MSRRIKSGYAVLTGKPNLVIPPSAENATGVYFLGYGEITPDVDPIDLQEKNKRAGELQVARLRAVERLMASKNISEAEAQRLLNPQTLTIDKREVVQPAQESLLDWLSDADAAKFFTKDEGETLDRVTELFTLHRTLYAVKITENAQSNAKTLKVAEPWFALSAQDWCSIDGVHFQIEAGYANGEIGVASLPRAVTAGEIIFLMKHDRSGYEKGDDTWTPELTAITPKADKEAIYRFYLKELGVKVEEESTPLENESENLNSGSELPALTGGEESTSESPTAPSAIVDLTPASMGIALVA